MRDVHHPVRLMASPNVLSHNSYHLITGESDCMPGGCPCVVDGTVDDAGGVWVHYSKAGMPLLRSGS